MNTTTERKFDSLLLDMDGTLWDAVDSYCAIWNAAIDECCPQVSHVTRPQLQCLMGTPIENIYEVIVGKACDYDEFMKVLSRKEHELMPALGGRLYDGVYDTLKELSKTLRLFLVSNCTAFGVPNFMRTTGLAPFFTDGISYGDTGFEKDRNNRIIIDRYGLKTPLYVGDTQGDCRSAHAAGVPFAWASYGFGRDVTGEEYRLGSIRDLFEIVGAVKNNE